EALAGMTRMGFTQTMLSPGSSSQSGTQLYMAPELLAGKPASLRSDIYSLGVVLFQLLIGDFTHPLTTDWHRKIDDPLLREDLEKCFAGNPEERFTKAAELADRLRCLERRRAEWATQEANQAARAHRKGRQKQLLFATAVFVLMVIGAGLWNLSRRLTSHGSVNSEACEYYRTAEEDRLKANRDDVERAIESYIRATT